MPSPRPSLLGVVALALAAAVTGPLLAQAPAKKHPRLVSAQVAKCSTCHAALTEGKKTVHAAVGDCTSCHEVTAAEGSTSITLAAQGPALCLTCHDGLADAVAGKVKAPHAVVADTCLGCHSPHASDEPKLLLAPQARLCGDCHGGMEAKHGNLLTAGTSCTSCHTPHGGAQPKLLVGGRQHPPFADGSCTACHRQNFGDRIRLQARGKRLCLACHEDPAAGGKGGSVHAALDDDAKGRAGCLACHSPHLSSQKGVLVKSGAALCASCHQSVVDAARAKTGHPPAAEDCTSCHLPHASGQSKLLTEPRGTLCANCHDVADAALKKKHLGANLAKADCLACHSPHGAGQPKLLARNVHPPVLEGCDTCHSGSFDKLAEGGGTALCAQCHSEIPEQAAKAPVQHAAMEMGSCTPCHNPHASPRAKLGKTAAAGCGSCHDDQVAGSGEVQHGIIESVGCQACHEPHGGKNAKLLRAKGTELCLTCHAEERVNAAAGQPLTVLGGVEIPAATVAKLAVLRLSDGGVRDHPAIGHRAIGVPTKAELERTSTTFKGELGCLVCHDPHKGKSAKLLLWGAASPTEACQHCHLK